jgi:phospholipase/lecithinase/hemolysin
MIAHRLRTTAFALCLLVPAASHGIIVFGDSLSDGGSDLALATSIHALDPAFRLVPGSVIGDRDTTGACPNGGVVDVASTVTATCVAAGRNSDLFRDGVSPTTRAQQIPAAQFTLAVPEPSEMALIFIGLFALLALVRRRRR